MLLGGLWHGASWHFVAWGGYHGFLLICYRIMQPIFDNISNSIKFFRTNVWKVINTFIFCFCTGHFWNGIFGIEEGSTWALSGWQLVAYSFCLGTVLLYHCTFFVNSLAHVWGTRPYKTTDTSRNNLLIAILTMGEGWHNNHHHFQSSARNGFRWYQIDATYMILKLLSFVGIVWDLKPVPKHVVHRTAKAEADQARKENENATVV